jgi:glycolate oxidase
MSAEGADHLRTIDEVIALAARRLDAGAHTWAAVGAGQGVTLMRNRLALNRLALVPRVGRDVAEVDTSTSVVGVEMALPVFLAPVGALGIYDPSDGVGAAQAAAAVSTSSFCPMLTTSPWADVAATAPGRHLFQIYVFGDRGWLDGLMAEIEGLGFAALCITMDSAVIGRRDRSIEDGYIWRPEPNGTVNLAGRGQDAAHRTAYTWADLEWLCGRTEMPVVVKGVMGPDDALKAVDCGAQAIYVSNHGGRMVDHGLSTIEALQEVVDAVPGSIDVVIDSGFTRGAEVVKALALGAKAVGIGKLQCWGMAAGGVSGLTRVLEILGEEIALTMANIGCRTVGEIVGDRVRWSFTADPPSPSAPL